MSEQGTQPSLLQTIETDLSNLGSWLKSEAVTTATALWNIGKAVFQVATADQAQVFLDVLNKLEQDSLAGKSLEQIETDMLNVATDDERAILVAIGSQGLQGLIAFVQAQKQMQAAKAAS